MAVLVALWVSSAVLGEVFYAYPWVAGDFCACVRRAVAPGDECRLHSGRHYVGDRCVMTGAHGTASEPIIVASAGDGPVVIDGTVAIGSGSAFVQDERGTWSAPSGGHQLLQLFIDGQLQVLARYPNARWSDKSVFYAVENWLRSKPPGEHNLSTGVGRLLDAGRCANLTASCCARCNAHDLADSGLNFTGALGVLNLYSCDTGVQTITRHDLSDPAVLHYRATWHGLCDTYRNGDGRYFLEGTPELLDASEEWLLDPVRERILVAMPPPNSAEIRGRVNDFALTVDDSCYVIFANFSLFATTISAAGDISNLTFSSLEFNYSGVSRRALGDQDTPPIGFTVWRGRDSDAGGPPKRANFVLDDIIVRYSDGPAAMINGANTVLTDSLFEWNDWTTVGGSWPLGVAHRTGKAHRATTVWIDDTEGVKLRRLTFRNNGAAQSINAGGSTEVPPKVQLCSFESQLAIQDDGSFVEGGGRPSTVYVQNWCTNTGKAGLRWDGYYSVNVTGGEMFRNVVWNASGLVVKGDAHNVTANTVFDGSDITASHASHDRPRYQDHTSPLNNLEVASVELGAGTVEYDPRADQLTVFEQNIFDLITIGGSGDRCPTYPNCTLPGKYRGNVIGTDTPQGAGMEFDLRAELRDPYHHDFRPCPGSQVSAARAGAYEPWSATARFYWIPGRRERQTASTPVPPTGSVGVHLNSELMFLPGRVAVGHSIFLGLVGGELLHLQDLDGEANIARPPQAMLRPNTAYQWRVDTIIRLGDGSLAITPRCESALVSACGSNANQDCHVCTGQQQHLLRTVGCSAMDVSMWCDTLADRTVVGQTWTFQTGTRFSCQIEPRPPPRPLKPGPAMCAAVLHQLCTGLEHTGGTVGSKCYECVVNNSKELKDAGCWVASRHAFIASYCDG